MDLGETIRLKVRLRNLKELLHTMIGMEEYELCGQLKEIIKRLEGELEKSPHYH